MYVKLLFCSAKRLRPHSSGSSSLGAYVLAEGNVEIRTEKPSKREFGDRKRVFLLEEIYCSVLVPKNEDLQMNICGGQASKMYD